jgi:hypothetical protein
MGYKNWDAPLIPHKGSLILVLGGANTITLEATPSDMRELIDFMRLEDVKDDPFFDEQEPVGEE